MGTVQARVRMYSRRRCGLCDEAREVIAAAGRAVPIRFDEVFIDGDDALELRYGLRIPVIEVDGVEAFELTVDVGRLEELLRRGAGY
jgi:Glutaredoxin-like domain (DUF836)